jgi:hypothetical protein
VTLKVKKSPGKDWFTGFVKINNGISLRKPEVLYGARAEGTEMLRVLLHVTRTVQLLDRSVFRSLKRQ